MRDGEGELAAEFWKSSQAVPLLSYLDVLPLRKRHFNDYATIPKTITVSYANVWNPYCNVCITIIIIIYLVDDFYPEEFTGLILHDPLKCISCIFLNVIFLSDRMHCKLS